GASCSMEVDKGVPVGSAGLGAAAAGTGETTLFDELRALPRNVLGATRVEIQEDNLYDLKWTREEDGEVETLDP
ncbi:hypothetical protein Tco_1513109, partial [Tanacetum coccineum]